MAGTLSFPFLLRISRHQKKNIEWNMKHWMHTFFKRQVLALINVLIYKA